MELNVAFVNAARRCSDDDPAVGLYLQELERSVRNCVSGAYAEDDYDK